MLLGLRSNIVGVVQNIVFIGLILLHFSFVKEAEHKGFERGKSEGLALAERKIARIEEKAQQLAKQYAQQVAEASKAYQELKAQSEKERRERYVEIQNFIKDPIYRNVCLDNNGLSEINRTIGDR